MYKHQLINYCFLLTDVAFIHCKSSTFPVCKVVTKQGVTMESFCIEDFVTLKVVLVQKKEKKKKK